MSAILQLLVGPKHLLNHRGKTDFADLELMRRPSSMLLEDNEGNDSAVPWEAPGRRGGRSVNSNGGKGRSAWDVHFPAIVASPATDISCPLESHRNSVGAGAVLISVSLQYYYMCCPRKKPQEQPVGPFLWRLYCRIYPANTVGVFNLILAVGPICY